MKESSRDKVIYSEIQKRLFYIIPEKWDSIYLYTSIIDVPNKKPIGEMYFYYIPKGIIKKKAVNGYEVPNLFNIDEETYSELITSLYNKIKELRDLYIESGRKPWSNITISIENFQFKIEYSFEELQKSKYSSYERHVIWRYNYLKSGLDSYSKKDRKIIDKYLVDDSPKPKTAVFVEGVYDKPVQSIIDYGKTLTVDEVMAQEEKQKKLEEQERIKEEKRKEKEAQKLQERMKRDSEKINNADNKEKEKEEISKKKRGRPPKIQEEVPEEIEMIDDLVEDDFDDFEEIDEEKLLEEARRQLEEEERIKEEARKKAEAEARKKAEAEARKKAEEEARKKAEEEARKKAEAEARAKALAEQKAKQEALRLAKLKAQEEARKKAEAEARAKALAEQKAKQEALRLAKLKA